ncbi:MAG TPA: kelch repeat-containing protein [Saprospiraceae bacterium]|nr:kelch repeat-containing protein [Saprospiraceae bacterium]
MKTIYTLFIVCFFNSFYLSAQTFIQKADFPGGIRWQGQQFTLGDKIYICGGVDTTDFLSDMWEYNTLTDSWTKKSDLPTKKVLGTATEFGGVAFLGLGWDGTKSLNDWWQYDNNNDSWVQKADFPGTPRYDAAAITWKNDIYILMGSDYDTGTATVYPFNDIWKYTPSTDTWVWTDTFPDIPRYGGFEFVVGDKLYYGFGQNDAIETWYSDTYTYDLVNHIWTKLASVPFTPCEAAGSTCYSGIFNNKIVLLNTDWNADEPDDYHNIYVYDIDTDIWTIYNKANPISWRLFGYGGTIGNKGYNGIGYDYEFDIWYKDFWEIDLAKVVTAIENQFPEYSNIKLNSTTRNIHVELPEKLQDHSQFLIQTIDGKELKQYALGNVTDIDITIFPVGAYVWSIKNNGALIKSGKIIRM